MHGDNKAQGGAVRPKKRIYKRARRLLRHTVHNHSHSNRLTPAYYNRIGAMMRAGRMVAVAVAAILVCCNADPHREQDGSVVDHSPDRYDANGHKTRNLDPLGGGNLVREVRESRHSGFLPFLPGRRYDFIGSYGSARRQLWPNTEYYRDDYPKRNFDEIDRSELDSFVGKRNIDEIDQPFPFAAKRFYNLYGTNYLDTPVSNFDKKRYRPDYPMDEIDLSHFPIGSKRSASFTQNRPLR